MSSESNSFIESSSSVFLTVFFIIVGLMLGISSFYGEYTAFSEIYNFYISNGYPGWSGQNSLYGQIALIFLAISIVSLLSVVLFALFGEESKTGYAISIGLLSYGVYEIVMSHALNAMIFNLKSAATAGIFFVITGVLAIVSTIKRDSEKANILFTITTMVFLGTWWYHGYINYTAVDPANYYDIFWKSIVAALGVSFGVFPFALLGGPATPVVLIGLIVIFILSYRAGDIADSIFASITSFFLIIAYVIGLATTIVADMPNLKNALLYINSSLDFNALYSIFSVFYGVLFIIFLFFGSYKLYEYITAAPGAFGGKIKPKPVGVIVKAKEPSEEIEETIEEIDIEDLDIDL